MQGSAEPTTKVLLPLPLAESSLAWTIEPLTSVSHPEVDGAQ